MTTQDRLERQAQYLRAIFDTIPIPTFIVDEDVRIQDFNTAAEPLLGPEPAVMLYHRGGEAFHCLHAEANGCGKSAACMDCVIRNSVSKALTGESTCRQIHHAQLRSEDVTYTVKLLVTASVLPYTEPPKAVLILEVGQQKMLHRSRGTKNKPRVSVRVAPAE